MKLFPIITSNHKKEYIPYEIIKSHENQAIKNHGQTLERLAQRGGLSWSEAYAVLIDSDFPHGKDYISEQHYEEKVKEMVREYNLMQG